MYTLPEHGIPHVYFLKKRCPEKMQQIYKTTPMPNLLCNFIEIALRHGCSPVNLLRIFRTPLLRNTSEWLLLSEKKRLKKF